MDANEGLPAGPTPSLCGDSLQGLQGRPGSLPEPAWKDLGSHAGDLHREPRVETSYPARSSAALNWSEVTWLLRSGHTTRPDRSGVTVTPAISTRHQRATSRSSSEYTRNWSGAVAPTT